MYVCEHLSKKTFQPHYKQDFSLPDKSFDVIFLRHKIAILCTNGFELMELDEYALQAICEPY